MNKERFVAAIEVSSSKIIAVVGKILPDGSMQVIASDQERGVEGVRYGMVQNPEETSMRVARIIDRLQRKVSIAPRHINGLFVGLSGRSLRSISTTVSLSLPLDTEITEEILDRLRQQALQTAIASSLTVVDAIPRTYTIDKYETTSPKGAVGNGITATYDLIVCRPELRRNLQRTLAEKTGIRIDGFIVTALATAQTVLSSEEKRQGCMLVDMGAETTTVSIYKDGHLMYFATLPMGGRNITRDLTSLNILEERAEDLKITSGNAIPRDTRSSLNLGGVKMSDVSNIIVARAEEIVANIIEQISYAELKESALPGGIVCIGGGSNLNGILDLIGAKTGLPVRRGQLPGYITITDPRIPAAEAIQAASVLYAGASASDVENLSYPEAQGIPQTGVPNDARIYERPADGTDNPENHEGKQSPRRSGRFLNFLANMFSGSAEDNSDLLD